MRKTLKFSLRSCIAGLLVPVFFLTSVWRSDFALASAPELIQNSTLTSLKTLTLPEKLGRLEDTFEPAGPAGNIPKIILIQDAHAIPDAQRSIRHLLLYLQKKYGIRQIAVEGAAAKLDAQMFTSFPDKRMLAKVLRGYMDRGELTGSVAAALMGVNPKAGSAAIEPDYFGVEDWKLYEQGLELYLKGMAAQEAALTRLSARSAKLEAAKQQKYSEKLLAVDLAEVQFRENQKDLPGFLNILATVKAPESGSEIALFLAETARQGNVPADLDKEVRVLAESIKRQAFSGTTRRTGQRQGETEILFNETQQAFQTGEIRAEQFALTLKEIALREKIQISISQALLHGAQNQKRLRDIEGTQFFKALETYTQSVKESLFASGEDRRLDHETHELLLLKKLAKLELSREEWNEVKSVLLPSASRQNNAPKSLVGAIHELPLQNDNDSVMQQTRKQESEGWIPAFPPKDGSAKSFRADAGMTKNLSAQIAFYKNAEQRDRVFFEKLKARAKPGEALVMIAGGFHAQGLMDRFKSAGMAYALVMPRIEHLPETSNYRAHMQGDVSWKNYFKVENGRVNLYEPFVRYLRDQLLNKVENVGAYGHTPLLVKSWRDQLIRDLSRAGRIEKAGEYTRFLDEKSDKSEPTIQDRLQKLEKFFDGLRKLDREGRFQAPNILQLLKSGASSTAGAVPSGPDSAGVLTGASLSLLAMSRRSEMRTTLQVAAEPPVIRVLSAEQEDKNRAEIIKGITSILGRELKDKNGITFKITLPDGVSPDTLGNAPDVTLRLVHAATLLDVTFTVLPNLIQFPDLSAEYADPVKKAMLMRLMLEFSAKIQVPNGDLYMQSIVKDRPALLTLARQMRQNLAEILPSETIPEVRGDESAETLERLLENYISLPQAAGRIEIDPDTLLEGTAIRATDAGQLHENFGLKHSLETIDLDGEPAVALMTRQLNSRFVLHQLKGVLGTLTGIFTESIESRSGKNLRKEAGGFFEKAPAFYKELAQLENFRAQKSIRESMDLVREIHEAFSTPQINQTLLNLNGKISEADVESLRNTALFIQEAAADWLGLKDDFFHEVTLDAFLKKASRLVAPEGEGLVRFELNPVQKKTRAEILPNTLIEILINLTRNSRQAIEQLQKEMGPDADYVPKITVSIQPGPEGEKSSFRIIVSDNGPGMTPEQSAKAGQGEAFTSTKLGSMGIGLSSSHQLIENLFHGKFEVTSKLAANGQPGETVITITLPITQPKRSEMRSAKNLLWLPEETRIRAATLEETQIHVGDSGIVVPRLEFPAYPTGSPYHSDWTGRTSAGLIVPDSALEPEPSIAWPSAREIETYAGFEQWLETAHPGAHRRKFEERRREYLHLRKFLKTERAQQEQQRRNERWQRFIEMAGSLIDTLGSNGTVLIRDEFWGRGAVQSIRLIPPQDSENPYPVFELSIQSGFLHQTRTLSLSNMDWLKYSIHPPAKKFKAISGFFDRFFDYFFKVDTYLFAVPLILIGVVAAALIIGELRAPAPRPRENSRQIIQTLNESGENIYRPIPGVSSEEQIEAIVKPLIYSGHIGEKYNPTAGAQHLYPGLGTNVVGVYAFLSGDVHPGDYYVTGYFNVLEDGLYARQGAIRFEPPTDFTGEVVTETLPQVKAERADTPIALPRLAAGAIEPQENEDYRIGADGVLIPKRPFGPSQIVVRNLRTRSLGRVIAEPVVTPWMRQEIATLPPATRLFLEEALEKIKHNELSGKEADLTILEAVQKNLAAHYRYSNAYYVVRKKGTWGEFENTQISQGLAFIQNCAGLNVAAFNMFVASNRHPVIAVGLMPSTNMLSRGGGHTWLTANVGDDAQEIFDPTTYVSHYEAPGSKKEASPVTPTTKFQEPENAPHFFSAETEESGVDREIRIAFEADLNVIGGELKSQDPAAHNAAVLKIERLIKGFLAAFSSEKPLPWSELRKLRGLSSFLRSSFVQGDLKELRTDFMMEYLSAQSISSKLKRDDLYAMEIVLSILRDGYAYGGILPSQKDVPLFKTLALETDKKVRARDGAVLAYGIVEVQSESFQLMQWLASGHPDWFQPSDLTDYLETLRNAPAVSSESLRNLIYGLEWVEAYVHAESKRMGAAFPLDGQAALRSIIELISQRLHSPDVSKHAFWHVWARESLLQLMTHSEAWDPAYQDLFDLAVTDLYRIARKDKNWTFYSNHVRMEAYAAAYSFRTQGIQLEDVRALLSFLKTRPDHESEYERREHARDVEKIKALLKEILTKTPERVPGAEDLLKEAGVQLETLAPARSEMRLPRRADTIRDGTRWSRSEMRNEQFKAHFDHFADKVEELLGDKAWYMKALSRTAKPPQERYAESWNTLRSILVPLNAGRDRIIALARQLGEQAVDEPGLIAQNSYADLLGVFIQHYRRIGGSVLGFSDFIKGGKGRVPPPFINALNVYFIYGMAAHKLLSSNLPPFEMSPILQPKSPVDFERRTGQPGALVQVAEFETGQVKFQQAWFDALSSNLVLLRQAYSYSPQLNQTVGKVYDDLLQQWTGLKRRNAEYENGVTETFQSDFLTFFHFLSAAMFVSSHPDLAWYSPAGLPEPETIYREQVKIAQQTKVFFDELAPGQIDVLEYLGLDAQGKPRSEMRSADIDRTATLGAGRQTFPAGTALLLQFGSKNNAFRLSRHSDGLYHIRSVLAGSSDHVIDSTMAVGRLAPVLVLRDDTGSRRHAEITLEDGGETLRLEDLGSSNGTTVDGVAIRNYAFTIPAIAPFVKRNPHYIQNVDELRHLKHLMNEGWRFTLEVDKAGTAISQGPLKLIENRIVLTDGTPLWEIVLRLHEERDMYSKDYDHSILVDPGKLIVPGPAASAISFGTAIQVLEAARSEMRTAGERPAGHSVSGRTARGEMRGLPLTAKLKAFWRNVTGEFAEEGGALWFLTQFPKTRYAVTGKLALWQKMREIRNRVRHEFPEHPLDFGFESIFKAAYDMESLQSFLDLGLQLLEEEQASPRLMFRNGIPNVLGLEVAHDFEIVPLEKKQVRLNVLLSLFGQLDRSLAASPSQKAQRFNFEPAAADVYGLSAEVTLEDMSHTSGKFVWNDFIRWGLIFKELRGNKFAVEVKDAGAIRLEERSGDEAYEASEPWQDWDGSELLPEFSEASGYKTKPRSEVRRVVGRTTRLPGARPQARAEMRTDKKEKPTWREWVAQWLGRPAPSAPPTTAKDFFNEERRNQIKTVVIVGDPYGLSWGLIRFFPFLDVQRFFPNARFIVTSDLLKMIHFDSDKTEFVREQDVESRLKERFRSDKTAKLENTLVIDATFVGISGGASKLLSRHKHIQLETYKNALVLSVGGRGISSLVSIRLWDQGPFYAAQTLMLKNMGFPVSPESAPVLDESHLSQDVKNTRTSFQMILKKKLKVPFTGTLERPVIFLNPIFGEGNFVLSESAWVDAAERIAERFPEAVLLMHPGHTDEYRRLSGNLAVKIRQRFAGRALPLGTPVLELTADDHYDMDVIGLAAVLSTPNIIPVTVNSGTDHLADAMNRPRITFVDGAKEFNREYSLGRADSRPFELAKDDPEVWLRKLAGIIEHLSASSKSEVRQKVPGTLTNSPVRVPGTFFRNFVTAGLLAAALGGPAAALLRAQESAPADEGFTVIAARPAAEKKAEEAPSVLDAMSPEERAALTTLPGPWAPIPASASPAVAASSAPKFADYLLPNPVTLAPPGSAKAGMPLFDVELPSSVYNVTTRKYGGFPGLLSDLLFYKPGMSWDVSKGELPPRFILKLPSKWPAAIAERTADGDAFPSYLLSIPKIQNASAPDEFIWLLADNVEGVAAREVLPFQVDRRLWQGVGFMRAEAEPRQWVLYPLYLPNAWLILTIGASGLAALFLVDRLRNRLTFSGPSPEETAPGTARGVKAAAFLAASLSKRSEMRSVLTDPHFPGTQEFKILVMIYLETRRRSAEGIDEAFLADWATKRGPFTPDNPNVPMDEILRRSGIATFDKLVRRAIDYGMEASIEGDMDAPFERILARIQPAAKKEEYRTAFAHLKTLMTQVFTEKLQGLMQQVAAGGLDALKPPAPPKHAQLRQKYGGILQEGIRSDADLRLAMEFIKEVSPEFGRKIVEQIEEHRIPVEMSGEPYSHASKSLYSLLQRKTAFASRVGIRKGAMIWEVIHEFTHALPIELLPEPLRSVENIEIKHNDDLEIIEAKLIGIGYLEEAVAIASEIHLFEDMQKAGLNQEAEALFIPSLSLGVQAYEAYGRTERDVAHLAAAIPTLFPQYKEQFEKMAKQDKHLMNEPRGRLQNLPWGSKFREFGVRVVRGENGLQLNVDAQQLSGKLSEALASAPPDQLIAQAFDFVQSILGTSRPRAAGEVTPESLTELQFPSRRKANPPDAHGIFARETEQTENRVRISGSFLQFFEKMDMAEKGNIEDFFDAVVAAARHLDGEQAAVLWQRAYAEARAKIRENPELMKKLGLALLDAGYASQGQYALQAYADAVLKRLWIAADYGESPLGGFLHALIERKQWVLAETVYRQILERIQGKKQLYHEDLIEHYERDGEFAPGGKEQALEFLGSKDPITAAEFHTLMLALAAAGLYTFTYDDSRDLPANGREESYFKGLQALATIADELKRDASLAAADKPSFAQALEKTSELAFDLAMRGSLQGLALIIAEWERSGVRYQGDWIAFVEGLEAKQDPDQGVGNLERVLLEGVQKVAWQLARSGETRRLVTFLKALPDGQIKLDLFDNTAYAMRKGTPEEIAAFVGEWERTLHGVAPRGEKNFFEKRDAAFVGRMQVMAPVKNWIIVKIEAEERRLGLQPAREAALKDFAGRFLSSGASALSGEKIIEAIKNQEPWKDRALFDRLTQAALASEPAARLVLLKRFAWFMPADSDYAQIRAYVEKINEALNAIAAGLGQRAVPLEMRLPAYTESYLFQSSQAAIAGFLIGATEPSLKAEGQRRLAALSADSRPILNPHQFWTPMSDVFGNETGGSIPTLSQFTPAIFHLEQVLKNSAEDPARAVAYADMAEPLLAAVTINPQAEEFHETENKLVLLMKTAALYGQAGRTQEAEALYHRLQLDVHKAKEEHARRQQALHEMTSVEAGLSGGDFRRLQSAVEAFQFWEQDLESRQSAALGRYEFTANPGTAQARIRAAEDAFRTDVDLRRERFDVRSMIAAAATLEEVPALQSHAARIYALAIQKLALMRGTDERVFDRGVDLLVKRLDESALPDHEKDVLLAQAMRDLLPPKGKRNPEDLINLSAGTLLTFAKKVIAKKKYPETEREVLKFFTEVAEDAAFDAGSSWKNRGKLHALMPLFEQILSANPEIAVHENFTLLRGLSSNAKYHESVLALHREPARQQPQGALNADAIRMGMDTAAVMDALLPDFDAALAGEGDEFALHAAGPLLLQLMHRDLAAFAAANKSEMRALTLAQLRAVPSFEALYSRAEPFLFSQAQRSPAQDYLVDILLDYSAKEFAQYKLALYRELLGNARVPLAIQQKAFNGVIAAGVVGEYARNFWSGTVLAGGAVSEERFYGWMKRFFDLNEEQLPSDRLLVYLFQNPDKDEAFFQSYAKMRQSFYLDVLKDGGGTHADDRRFSYNFSWQSNEDFLRVFEGVVQRHRLWVPDLSNEIDVLLVYDRHHVRGTSQPIGEWLSHLRHWYVDGLFDAANVHNANFYHSIEQIEEELKRLIPGFQWTEGQRTHVEGFALRGRVDYRELTRYLNLQLSGAAVEKWRLFLELPDKESARTTPKDFGIPVLDAGQRARLDQMLDRMQKDFNAREDILREKPVEVPAVFQNSPPLVRFALISYFKMLPFGRREAILADFNTEGLTEEQAIKRFFEVTGNEKLGQFLSFRRDLVPERYRAQLESFQENVAPSAFEEVRGTIEKELGGRIEQFFTSINPVPLNVGTIGEVYEVVLKDGTRGVIKVITPSRRKAIETNLARIRSVVYDIQRNQERFDKKIDVESLFREFARSMREEMDFRNEFKNAQDLRAILPPDIGMPEFYEPLVRQSILVQSFVAGRNPRELPEALQRQTANRLSTMFMDHVLFRGLYHDDLHAGNIRVDETGKIWLLDFGRMGRLTTPERDGVIPLLFAIAGGDPTSILGVLEQIGVAAPDFDRAGLQGAIERTLAAGHSTTDLINALFYEAGSHGLQIKSAFLQLLKGILTIEGTAQTLDPEFRLDQQVQAFVMANAATLLGGFFGGGAMNSLVPAIAARAPVSARVRGTPRNVALRPASAIASADKPAGRSEMRSKLSEDVANVQDLVLRKAMPVYMQAQDATFRQLIEANRVTYGDRDTDVLLGILEETGGTAGGFNEFIPEIIRILQGVELKAKSSEWILAKLFSRYEPLDDSETERWGLKILNKLDTAGAALEFTTTRKFESFTARFSEDELFSSTDGQDHKITVTTVGPLVFVIADSLNPVTLQNLKEKLRDEIAEYPNNIIFTEKAVYNTRQIDMGFYTTHVIAAMLKNAEAFRGAVVADFGAGHGILAQVALALGAAHVMLADYEHLTHAEELLSGQGYVRDNTAEPARGSFSLHTLDFTEAKGKRRIREFAKQIDIALVNIGPWEQYLPPGASVGPNYAVMKSLSSAKANWNLLLNSGYHALKTEHVREMNKFYDFFWRRGDAVETLFHSGSSNESNILQVVRAGQLVLGEKPVRPPKRSEMRALDLVADGLTQYAYGKVTDEILAEVSDRLEKAREDISVEQIIEIEREIVTRKLESIQKNKIRRQDKNLLLDIASDNLAADFKNLNGGFAVGVTLSPEDDAKTTALNLIAAIRELRDAGALKRAMVAANPAQRRALSDEAGEADLAPDAIQLLPDLNRVREHQLENGQTVLANATSAASQVSKLLVPVEMLEDHAGLSVADLEMLEAVSVFMQLAAGAVIARESKFGSKPEEIRGKLNQLLQIKGAEIDEKVLNAVFRPKGEGFSLSQKGLLGILQVLETQYDAITAMRAAA